MKKKIIYSLGFRLAFLISSILLVLSLIIILHIEHKQQNNILSEETAHAETIARTLLQSLKTIMLTGKGNFARKWLDSLKEIDGILDFVVLRPDKEEAYTDMKALQAVNDYLKESRFKRDPIPTRTFKISPDLQFQKALQGKIGMEVKKTGQLSFFMPIILEAPCMRCHGYAQKGDVIGVLKLNLSTQAARNRIAEMRKDLLIDYTIVALLLGVVLWAILRYSVLFPITHLRNAMIFFGQGRQSPQLPVDRCDELGELAETFNTMREELRNCNSHVNAISRNVADGIITINSKGIIESFNAAAELMFGYRLVEIIGKNISTLLVNSEKNDNFIYSYLKSEDRNVCGTRHEVTGKHKNGSVFPMEIGIHKIYTGKHMMFISISR